MRRVRELSKSLMCKLKVLNIVMAITGHAFFFGPEPFSP